MRVRSLSIANILQRRWPALLVCLGLLAGAGLGQMRKSKGKTPRALALVEWPASGPPRLVPITIQIDGRLYDAGIYKASPVPMALDSGNVYEVEQSGASVGFFTVYDAKEVKDNWYGEGQWRSNETMEAQRKAAAASEAAAAEARARAQEDADKPPTLRRGGPENPKPESPPPSPAPPPGPPPPRGPDEPPVLRRPSAPPPRSTEPEPAPASAPSAAAPAASSAADDSGRPVLRRGAPRGTSQAASLPGSVVVPSGAQATSVPSTAARVASKAAGGAVTRVLPAISDAGGPEPRSYLFELSPAEEQRLSGLAKTMASAELQNYAKGHPNDPRPGPLQDAQVRSFDLAYTNSPLLVLTARAGAAPPAPEPARRPSRGRGRTGAAAETPKEPEPQAAPVPPDFSYYVTVVAREDINGDLRRLFVSTTDSNHLDAFSRLELIDAVDADGDGRGELLFREISDTGSAFLIYRAGPDNLSVLFNSAELER